MQQYKMVFRFILAIAMVAVGAMHFITPDPFIRIVPDFLPFHAPLVYASGGLEMIGGVGLLIPKLSQAAAWLLVVLFITVFPANLYQAIYDIPVPALPSSPPLIWLRLPFQALLVAWAWWLTRQNDQAEFLP